MNRVFFKMKSLEPAWEPAKKNLNVEVILLSEFLLHSGLFAW